MNNYQKSLADALAYSVCKAINRGDIDPRSAVGDDVLDYLEIGTGDYQDIHEFMLAYEQGKIRYEESDLYDKLDFMTEDRNAWRLAYQLHEKGL